MVKYFDAFLNLIPLSFVLGFYVSYVASRTAAASRPAMIYIVHGLHAVGLVHGLPVVGLVHGLYAVGLVIVSMLLI